MTEPLSTPARGSEKSGNQDAPDMWGLLGEGRAHARRIKQKFAFIQ